MAPPHAIHVDQSKSAHVLVVEDEVLVRTDLAEALRAAGLVVLEAANGDEAVDLLRARDEIAAVLTDIRMGGPSDGLELAQWVRREMPNTAIILVSGNFLSDLEIKIDAIFSKPYQVDAVVRRVKDLIQQRQQAF